MRRAGRPRRGRTALWWSTAAIVVLVTLLSGCDALRQAGQEPGKAAAEVATPTPSPGPNPPAEVIPWADASAGDTSTRPAAATCGSGNLEGSVAWQRPAGGAVVGNLELVNAGDEPCALDVHPAVRLLDGDERLVESSAPPRPDGPGGGPTELVLNPDGKAEAELWWTSWCGDTLNEVTVALDLDGAALVTEPAATTPPPCSGPAPALEARQLKLTDPEGGMLFADATTLRIELDLPDTATPGEPLRYQVTLTNPESWTVLLEPCPNHRDELQLPTGGAGGGVDAVWTASSASWHRLNCASLGGRLPPGASATFEMLTELPASAPEGFAHLRWTLEANRRIVRAEQQFLVR